MTTVITDIALTLVAVADLAIGFKYAAHLNKQENEPPEN